MGIALIFLIVYFTIRGQNPKTSSSVRPAYDVQASSSLIAALVPTAHAETGIPEHISIPSIGVDAHIEQVGLTASGAVDVPKVTMNAAWFDQSPQPGKVGNAIIDGHYGWKNNIPAVFDRLSSIEKGDVIFITSENGTTFTFIVKNIVAYDENNNDPAIFISTDGKAHLNLITCGGVWNQGLHSYAKRLVVFADLVETP